MSSSSTIAPLVSVSGYTGKVLRIGRAFNPFKKKKMMCEEGGEDDDDEEEEEEEEDEEEEAEEDDTDELEARSPAVGGGRHSRTVPSSLKVATVFRCG